MLSLLTTFDSAAQQQFPVSIFVCFFAGQDQGPHLQRERQRILLALWRSPYHHVSKLPYIISSMVQHGCASVGGGGGLAP